MKQNLIEVIEQYSSFTDRDKELIMDRLNILDLKQGEIFIEKDIISDKIGFVISGVLRYYDVDSKGNEVTINFLQKNDFIALIRSFYYGEKTTVRVHAETNCTILYLTKEDFNFLNENVNNWLKALLHFAGEYLLEINLFLRVLVTEDAKTSYLRFLEKYPEVAKKVSLGHIASFLGITQSTLSRIRKQLVS